MKICAISDAHGHLITNIPECDVLVMAGDMEPNFENKPKTDAYWQVKWLDTEFRDWLECVPAKEIVGIAGNHSWVFQLEPNAVEKLELPWHYLQDSEVVIDGVKFYGTPWQKFFCDWSFNAPEYDVNEEFLRQWFDKIPEDTDVLITHTPPYGILDQIKGNGKCLGSIALREKIEKINPKISVYGHIHDAKIIEKNVFNKDTYMNEMQREIIDTTTIPGLRTQFINASILNDAYKVAYEPVIIEI